MKARNIAIRIWRKRAQPCEDASEVVTDSGEDGVGGIAGAAFEIAAAEATPRAARSTALKCKSRPGP